MTDTNTGQDSPLYNRSHDALTAALNDDRDAILEHCQLLTRSELAHLVGMLGAVAGTALTVLAETWPDHPVTEAAMRRHQARTGEKP